jgi:hypothetical protein
VKKWGEKMLGKLPHLSDHEPHFIKSKIIWQRTKFSALLALEEKELQQNQLPTDTR